MYINGKAVKELREAIGMSRHDLAEHLALDVLVLEEYEDGELWLEEDMFRLWSLSVIMEDSSYMIDGEHKEMLDDLDE